MGLVRESVIVFVLFVVFVFREGRGGWLVKIEFFYYLDFVWGRVIVSFKGC